ncbi:MAG: right-handed parallel beta-helix repeat-containing protein, partial [Actinobacteria bacterium]|nr:right-handed parallel beta-helix repeat-containing protein [Actinomycetota bacterium]
MPRIALEGSNPTMFCRLALVAAVITSLTVALPGPASAAAPSLVVDTLADGHDADTSDAVCATAASVCSLRAAVETSKASGVGAEEITFSVTGTHLLDPAMGTLVIHGDLVVAGNGSGVSGTVISGGDSVRVIATDYYYGTLTLRDLRVQDGHVSDANCCMGAGINNYFGPLNLERVVVANNEINISPQGAAGAGVSSGGPVTMLDSTIKDNTIVSYGYGAGLYSGGPVSITSSTISGNSTDDAQGWGGPGGIQLANTYSSVITNSTIANNTGAHSPDNVYGVGGIYANQSLTITNSTIADNTGGQTANIKVLGDGMTATMRNVIVTGSATNGNQSSTDPGLGALADNGGPTFTRAIGKSSPATDTGDGTYCPA